MPTEPNGKNGKIYQFIKKWWFMAPLLLAFVGTLYGFGKKVAVVDSVLKRHEEILQKQDAVIAKMSELVIALDKNQAVQSEFFRLMKPGLWQQAMERTDSLNGGSHPDTTR